MNSDEMQPLVQKEHHLKATLKLSVQHILVILSASDTEQMQQTSLQSEAL